MDYMIVPTLESASERVDAIIAQINSDTIGYLRWRSYYEDYRDLVELSYLEGAAFEELANKLGRCLRSYAPFCMTDEELDSVNDCNEEIRKNLGKSKELKEKK